MRRPRLTQLIIMITAATALSSTLYAVQTNAEYARSQLSKEAIQKVKQGGIDLNKLLANPSNDLIVEYVSNTPLHHHREQLKQTYTANKQRVKAAIHGKTIQLRDYYYLPYTFERITNPQTLISLLNNPDVKAVYPNNISRISLAESLPLIRQPQAASLGYRGTGTSIAVLDTGANYTVSDLGQCTAANTPSNTCRVSYAVDIAIQDNSLDANGHGTNVSSIAAAVAPDAKIIALDVFTSAGAYDSDIIAGINWVISNQQALNIKAVNLSLGSGKYTSACTNNVYVQPFANLRAAGVIPVVASGNNGYTNAISSPACTPGAVSVGAVHDGNNGWFVSTACQDFSTAADKVTCFSNSSSLLTLLAPGAQITAGGSTKSGTSQATPHVAGAIAVLRAQNAAPNDSLDQTISRLTSTGKVITDSRNNLKKPRINLEAATLGLSSPAPTTTTTTTTTNSGTSSILKLLW